MASTCDTSWHLLNVHLRWIHVQSCEVRAILPSMHCSCKIIKQIDKNRPENLTSNLLKESTYQDIDNDMSEMESELLKRPKSYTSFWMQFRKFGWHATDNTDYRQESYEGYSS